MNIISQVAKGMNSLLINRAEALGIKTKFVKRTSKLNGSAFVQTLVFGWMANPNASLGELTQVTSSLGIKISSQGLEKRFNPEACELFEELLSETVKNMVLKSSPVAIPIFERFNGIYIDDSSRISLPKALEKKWKGSGGSNPGKTSSCLRIQVRFNFKDGSLYGPILEDGCGNDKNCSLQKIDVPKGSLRLFDLGYFNLRILNNLYIQDVYWLSRLQAQTTVYDETGKQWDVVDLLNKYGKTSIDIPIKIGTDYRIPCRLIARPVSQEVANDRRRKIKREAICKGQSISKTRLKMADWSIFITNASSELMSLEEALVLVKVRWQIELLFKLWKSHGLIDEWRSGKTYRILCEVYAKLLIMIIQHWLFLTGCWTNPDRSLIKSAKTIQKYALYLAISLKSIENLSQAIIVIRQALVDGCKIDKRKKKPSTFQLLLSLT